MPSRKRAWAAVKEDVEEEVVYKTDEPPVSAAASNSIPPVNSDWLPLPWKGRLGYACLNTYLRQSNPPVFSSRTCRIQSILEHRHPLQDPTEPESPKNRPDLKKPENVELGMKWVQSLGVANARDIAKMIRWNDRYGIKFMRLSSEMFPFASHETYGYKLEPFAAEVLAEAGKVIAELGHRVSVHPGQYTQLASIRQEVVENAIRDLEYHDEKLSLLKLPEQQDRDAVMIIHMGGTYGDKAATLNRFRTNYARLSDSIKRRLVLENDDMCYSVHDLLPICQELSIPLVLDFHHHNIIYDSTKLRGGSLDIMQLFPAIKETWTRKGITQKMHYSEPTQAAVTPMEMRKHSPRVATLPPCAQDMDLMIEAKDKEQAVFALMKKYQLPGFDVINDLIPHTRMDENLVRGRQTAATEKSLQDMIPDDEVGMGGIERRVYWPEGMESWLLPKKKERATKVPDDGDGSLNSVPSKVTSPVAKKQKSGKARTKKKKAVILTLSESSDAGENPKPSQQRSTRGPRVSYKEHDLLADS